MGAHVHFADIRVPTSKNYKDVSHLIFSTPSVSPIFGNNPGYSFFELNEDNTFKTLNWRFFMLQEYTFFKHVEFKTVDPQKQFSINLNDNQSIRNFADSM
jgi:hypothetical protein